MNELPVVHKFGGSCLRDASDLEHIAEIITKADHPVVLVVSALWGTTDRLMRAAPVSYTHLTLPTICSV